MKIRQIFCLFLIMFVIPAIACRWPALEQEQQTDLIEKTYYIDPPTLFRSLAQGDDDSFMLQTVTPVATPHLLSVSVSWKQIDYFFIAKSFYKLALGESQDTWKISKMYFKLDCKDVTTGLQQGGFTFFKTEHIRGRDTRLMRYINIAPMENEIYFSETEYYPELVQWQSMDISQVKISAESALKIAENEGGSKIRTDVGNNCYITEIYDVNGKYDGWSVWYSSDNGSIFEINIDPFTGKYEQIR